MSKKKYEVAEGGSINFGKSHLGPGDPIPPGICDEEIARLLRLERIVETVEKAEETKAVDVEKVEEKKVEIEETSKKDEEKPTTKKGVSKK